MGNKLEAAFSKQKPPPLSGGKKYIYKIIDSIPIPISVLFPSARYTAARAPVMLFIHGGGWTGGNRQDYSRPLFYEFLARGFVVASADYRLLPETPLSGQLDDIRDIEPWLRVVLPQVSRPEGIVIDYESIIVVGASAGAHLALLTPKLWKTPPRAILSMYGPTDMHDLPRLRRGLLKDLVVPPCTRELIAQALLVVPPTEIPEPTSAADFARPRGLMSLGVHQAEVVAEFLLRGVVDGGLPHKGSVPREEIDEISPLYLCARIKYPPVYQVIGTNDEAFDISHVKRFDAKLKHHGGWCETVIVPDKGHAFDMLAEVGGEIHEQIFKPAAGWLVQFVNLE